MQGKSINGFILQRLLGTGGMAEVWYAENEIGMKAAVKILSEELSHNAQMQERFINEAKVMVKLDHPNIRKVHGYGEIDGRPAIIMEFLDGSDLKARMKSGQHFTEEELKRWWNQMVDALNYTHAQNIVHRDIKPSNIFIDQKGDAKLLDFGVAKMADTTSGTLTGVTLGTRIYMSPEQVRDPKRVGTASDAYSLAVTFVHLLTGQAPYDSTTSSDYDIQVSIVTKPVDMSKVPTEWQGFLMPYLTKEPDQRPMLRPFEVVPKEGKEEKKKEDGAILTDAPQPQPKAQPSSEVRHGGTPSTASRHSGLDPLSPTPEDKLKSKKALWIALAAAAVAAIAAILLLRQPKQEPVPLDPETEEFLACQTVVDYRAYCANYGLNAAYYEEAQRKIDSIVNDSLQNAAAEALAAAIIDESSAYQQCTTIAGCRAYLMKYPNGTHASQVRETLTGLEDDEAFAACTTLAACDAYLRKYPQGRHVADVRKKREEFAAQAQQQGSSNGGGDNVQPAPTPATPAPRQPSNPSNTLPNTPDSPQPAPQPTPQPAPEPTAPSFTGSANGHEWVDLGLQSGMLWATCNIGASTPEGYGNYYAWGETTTKDVYNTGTYTYANGNYDKLTKYCNKSEYGDNGFTDNLTTLQGRDDPATSWGSGWHTPSKAQWDELLANTTNQWTTKNGVQGRLFTSKKNGQTLFLPAAGYRWDSDLYDAGSYGDYWSRSLYTGDPDNAWRLDFNSGNCIMSCYLSRGSGQSVRPVREK